MLDRVVVVTVRNTVIVWVVWTLGTFELGVRRVVEIMEGLL